MGKRLQSQNRGKGTPRYTSPTHKRKGAVKYRKFDESERKDKIVGTIIDILHDPGRSSPVARVRYDNGEERLILIPEGMKIKDTIECGISAEIKPGNVLPLGEVPEGIPVYNIETIPGDGGKLVRSGGCYAHVITHDVSKTIIKLPSGHMKTLNPAPWPHTDSAHAAMLSQSSSVSHFSISGSARAVHRRFFSSASDEDARMNSLSFQRSCR
jgi:large subunit ribosomal protein L2